MDQIAIDSALHALSAQKPQTPKALLEQMIQAGSQLDAERMQRLKPSERPNGRQTPKAGDPAKKHSKAL